MSTALLVGIAVVLTFLFTVWLMWPECRGGHHWKDEPRQKEYTLDHGALYRKDIYACHHEDCHKTTSNMARVSENVEGLKAVKQNGSEVDV